MDAWSFAVTLWPYMTKAGETRFSNLTKKQAVETLNAMELKELKRLSAIKASEAAAASSARARRSN
jgi:hypothetical protein